jgi:hypothetical protein
MAKQFDDAAARRMLAVIMHPEGRPADQTIEMITGKVEMADVLHTVQALAELDPPVVLREHDAGLEIGFWFAIEPGASAWPDGAPER